MKKKRGILLIILTVVVIVVVCGAIAVKSLDSNLKQLAGLDVQDVNLSAIADGTYSGSYGSFPVSAEVEVTVKNREIAGINLVRHNHGQGAAAEVIPGKVVEAQTLAVDTVTGATYSSIVILKAIEDALSSALE
jgi:uncharacterized protein with FMN-binding domain